MAALPLRLALFYAAVFVVFGVRIPFWPPWLAARGLTAQEISLTLALTQWASVAAAPLAGVAADRQGDAKRIMLLLSSGAVIGFLLCLPAKTTLSLSLLGVVTGALLGALIPLGDNVTLAAAYAGKLDYGRMRLCGSASFIAATVLAGMLLENNPGELTLDCLIGAAILAFGACLALPSGARALRQARPGAWSALAQPRFLAFLGAATLIQGSHVVFYAFGVIHWQSLGLGTRTISLLWSEGVVAEVLLFFWGARFLRFAGPLGLLVLGGGAGILRWTVMAFASSVSVLAVIQVLHALTFAASHLGAMHHLARTIPPGQGATGQAVYGAVVGGIGPGLLMLVAGAAYGAAGGLAYLAMAGLAGAGAIVALALSARKS